MKMKRRMKDFAYKQHINITENFKFMFYYYDFLSFVFLSYIYLYFFFAVVELDMNGIFLCEKHKI